jgi:uncharacterized radical SAM superfamily protein
MKANKKYHAAVKGQACEISWQHHGQRLDIFLPGMFVAYGRRGRYPAVSLTGSRCDQGCDHCGGRLLETMLPVTSPSELRRVARRAAERGDLGLLVSGGSDPKGRLPWEEFIPTLAEIKAETGLILTAHVARIDKSIAQDLKEAGIRQALIDVVGDETTAREVLHLTDGLAAQEETLAACSAAGLEIAPHIILGLHHGEMRGERAALERLAALDPRLVVFVVLMPMKGTAMAGAVPPSPQDVAEFLVEAREILPRARHHLGCARPRGRYRAELDRLAVYAGINALAVPSDAAMEAAAELGLEVVHHDTCCSVYAAHV